MLKTLFLLDNNFNLLFKNANIDHKKSAFWQFVLMISKKLLINCCGGFCFTDPCGKQGICLQAYMSIVSLGLECTDEDTRVYTGIVQANVPV